MTTRPTVLTWKDSPRLSPAPLVAGTQLWRDYLELTKPRLTALVGFTVAAGSAAAGAPRLNGPVALAMLGTTLLVAGGCAVNQALEGDVDSKMERTRSRPVASGRMPAAHAMAFGLGLAAFGLGMLAVGTNALTCALGLVAAILYLAVYTPMKRTSTASTLVGAIPGALPVAMGVTAVTGRFDLLACSLFAILFAWQLPHFAAIAWMRRDDYEASGLPMLSVVDRTGGFTARQACLHSFALIPISLTPALMGVGGAIYFKAALISSVVQHGFAWNLAMRRTESSARQLFLISLVQLPVTLGSLILEKWVLP